MPFLVKNGILTNLLISKLRLRSLMEADRMIHTGINNLKGDVHALFIHKAVLLQGFHTVVCEKAMHLIRLEAGKL